MVNTLIKKNQSHKLNCIHCHHFTVQITFIFIDFRVCDFAFAFIFAFFLNAFYFQIDFNLRFKRKRDVRLTCKRV